LILSVVEASAKKRQSALASTCLQATHKNRIVELRSSGGLPFV